MIIPSQALGTRSSFCRASIQEKNHEPAPLGLGILSKIIHSIDRSFPGSGVAEFNHQAVTDCAKLCDECWVLSG